MLLRPGKGISPEDFFTKYLPELARALFAGVPPPTRPLEAEVVLEGTQSFVLSVGKEGLAGRIASVPAPLLRASCTLEDWRAIVRDLWPRLLRFLEKERERTDVELRRLADALGAFDTGRLTRNPGRIDLEFTDDAGDTVHVSFAVGTGLGPTVEVAFNEGELWSLLRARGGWAKAITSKLRMQGDVAYLVRLLARS